MPSKSGRRPPNHKPNSKRVRRACAIAVLAIVSTALWPQASDARGTRVKPGVANRVFVMAGFKQDACTFMGFPEMQLDTQPAKGQVSFKPGEPTTVQYSLSGNCIGTQVEGTGIYYTPAPGQSGPDTFTVTGRLGTGEPATRTFSVIIDENGGVLESFGQ